MDAHLMRELELLYDETVSGLADTKRLIILYVLREGSRYVGELATELGMSQSSVSRHLRILREHGLVKSVHDNTAVYYSLYDERLIQALDLLRTILRDRLLKQAEQIEPTARDTGRKE